MKSAQRFAESAHGDWSKEREALLQRKIDELGLAIEGRHLEQLVHELYRELEGGGIDLRPQVYLSDEWGCPDGVPAIGIPFYLADERLRRLEDELMEGIEAETDDEILSYLLGLLRLAQGHAAHRFGRSEMEYRQRNLQKCA